jgi:hypothetical protein
MRVTRPALIQLVQAFTRRGVPSTSARTRCTFGSHRRLFRLCENVTDFPNHGFLPQMSQTAAIGPSRVPEGWPQPEGGQLPDDRLEVATQDRIGDRTGVGEVEGPVRPEEGGHGLSEEAERGLDRVGDVEDARERHPELLHERLRLGPRVQDVDADELHPVSELAVGGHETRHLIAARRAPFAPEVDHHGSALQLRQ